MIDAQITHFNHFFPLTFTFTIICLLFVTPVAINLYIDNTPINYYRQYGATAATRSARWV
jgi:hypothetical protein